MSLEIFDPHIHTIRKWLLDQRSPNVFSVGGVSLLEWAVRQGDLDDIEGLLRAGADINQRNSINQGWCFWGIQAEMDMWLFQRVLYQMNKSWWFPDHLGEFVFFEQNLSFAHANVLAARWWSERLPWSELKKNGESPQKYWEVRSPEISRLFSFWAGRIHFTKTSR